MHPTTHACTMKIAVPLCISLSSSLIVLSAAVLRSNVKFVGVTAALHSLTMMRSKWRRCFAWESDISPIGYVHSREKERSDKAWSGWPEQNSVSLCRTGATCHYEWGQPTSQGKKWLDYYKKNLLCFELEQIWDYIYYTIRGHLYSNCGVQFVVATLG